MIEKARREGILSTIETAFNRLDQPLALGYSSSGTVIQVGEVWSISELGDRVVCAGGGHAVHAEFSLVPENLAAHLSDNVDFESGAFATLGAIALNGFRLAAPQVGETIAVIGLGLLGIGNSANGKCGWLSRFLEWISTPTRQIRTNAWSGSVMPNRKACEHYLAYTNGRGFDHVLICADTPSDETVELAGVIARDRGHVVSLGVVGLNLPRKFYFEKELFFQVSRSAGPGRYDSNYEEKGADYPLVMCAGQKAATLKPLLTWLATGKVDVKPLITHRFTIEEANRAYDLITGKTKTEYLGVLLT